MGAAVRALVGRVQEVAEAVVLSTKRSTQRSFLVLRLRLLAGLTIMEGITASTMVMEVCIRGRARG